MHLISLYKSFLTKGLYIILPKPFNIRTTFFCSLTTIPANSKSAKPIPISIFLLHPKTLSSLLKQQLTLSQLKQIHSQIIIQAFFQNHSLLGALIHYYTSSNNLHLARSLFDRYPTPPPPTLLWNIMIQAYTKTSNSQESIHLFHQMSMLGRSSSVNPDKYTFNSVITACSRHPTLVRCGVNVHGLVIKNGLVSDIFVGNSIMSLYTIYLKMEDAWRVFNEMPMRDVVTWTSLVRGYAKCGELVTACKLFNKMPVRNDVSWAVMIASYVRAGRHSDALRCFHDMLYDNNVKPNEAVLVCALSACAHLGALDQGKWIHVYIDKNGVAQSSNISTALIDMYAKCGRIDCANRVFNGISRRDVLMWTSMISGLSMHGLGKDALGIFSQMLENDIKPDNITILGVLNGCSHSGLVKEGCLIFYNMEHLWGIMPKIEHYGCLIDLLGRAGHLEKAFKVVKSMPMEPDVIIWRALLSACRIHGEIRLGKRIIDYIAQLDPSSHGGGHVLLSNLYASVGQWDKVTEVRNAMDEKGIESSPGCSWIEIDGAVHEFLAADRLHPRIVEIHKKLEEILKRVSIEGGYVPSAKQALFDLSEEEKAQAVSWHSEKLAVAFGLLSTGEATPIRIIKNLRICEDCHSAMKAISHAFNRDIVVRDRSRFHTFKEGNCSCTDYW